MGKKLSKPGEEGHPGAGSPQKGKDDDNTTRTNNTEGEDEDVGPLEDYDIDDQFSKSNDKPLTIDDFELLKVGQVVIAFVYLVFYLSLICIHTSSSLSCIDMCCCTVRYCRCLVRVVLER